MHICIRDSSRSRKSSSSKREQQRYGESDISAEQALMNDMCKLASTGLELPQAMASHRVVPTRFKFKIAPVSERPLPMVATKLRLAVPTPMHVAHFCVELHPPNIRRDGRVDSARFQETMQIAVRYLGLAPVPNSLQFR